MSDTLAVELFVDDRKANATLERFKSNALKSGKAIEAGVGTSFAGKVADQLQRAEIRHKQYLDKIKAQEAASTSALALASSAGALVGSVAGSAIVAGGIQALQAAKEAENSLRLLKATAKETGLEFKVLRAQAEDFGKAVSLSNSDAQRTYAQLANFANAAGRGDKLEEFRKSFSDLAAAKGINASQLGDISRQLNALTDEATDKLLNANPSAFYAAFASGIGKTAETLTDAEKRAAVFDAVLRKGSIFTGEADRKLESFSGRVDSLSAALDNLKTSAGNALKPAAEFGLAIPSFFANGPSGAGAAVANNSDFFGGKPISIPIQLSLNLADNTTKRLSDLIFGNDFTAQISQAQAYAASIERVNTGVAQLRASDSEINAAKSNPFGSLRNFALSKINLATGFSDPAARQKAIDEAVKGAELYRNDLGKRLEAALGSGDATIIGLANKQFRQNINLFDLDTREKLINQFSAGISSGFREGIEAAKKDVPKLRALLKQITESPDLTQRDRRSLVTPLAKEIENLVIEGKARLVELEKTVNGVVSSIAARRGSENPFVRLFSDAEAAIESSRRSTRGLSAELRAVIENQVKAANRGDLFNARLDAGLGAFDLRGEAAKFRGAAGLGQMAFDAATERLLGKPIGYDSKGEALFDTRGKNIDAIQSYLDTQRKLYLSDADNKNAGAQGRLDAQIAIIERLRSGAGFDDAEAARAAADKRIIAITAGLDASTLTDRQREAAASAREREASRLDNAEKTAVDERRKTLELQEAISADLGRLVKAAESEGIEGIIRIVDETGGKVETRLGRRAGERDVSNYYER